MRAPRIAAIVLFALATAFAQGCVDKPTEHRVRANAFLNAGKAEDALKEVDLGLKAKKDDAALLILKGKALFELQRLDDARGAYESALAAGKALPAASLTEAHLGLAIIATRQEKWKDARAHFDKLVEVNPKDAHARLNLARVCLRMNDMECAVSHGEEAGHLRGNAEDVLFTLGRIYIVAKRYEDAEKTFAHICEVVPGASSCPYGIALVAAQKGDKKKALTKLQEAIDRKLPNPEDLAKDALLAPLRDDADFKAMAAKAAGG